MVVGVVEVGEGYVTKSWLRKFGQWLEWIFCLTAARILAANQELT